MNIDFSSFASLYKHELLDNVVPFWLNHSQDKQYGGYFTCLDRKGDVFDTDKFVWLQGREVWMFSLLYNRVEKKQEWLDCAIQGAEFLEKHAHDGSYNWFFSLTQDGTPIVQPYNIFSYAFAALAFGELSKATGDKKYEMIAKKTFDKILEKAENPKGKWEKHVPNTRPMKSFALPMILCNLVLELDDLIDSDSVEKIIDTCITEVLDNFYQPELGLIVEHLSVENQLVDSFDGRLLNPGHALEAMWFIMDLGEKLNRPELIEKAKQIALQELNYGWDKEKGGIFYFMDRLGHPTQQLEWDQKLWWVHFEAAIAMLKGYSFTKDEVCLQWFERIHTYLWQNFKDENYPEWYGYLNRDAKVLLPLKGGKWKGFFHVPRGLFQCWQLFEKLSAESSKGDSDLK